MADPRAGTATARPAVLARPSPVRMVLAHARHASRAFLRTPIAAFFTLAFPLVWLVAITLITGNMTITTPVGSMRLAQVLTPVAAVFAAVMAAYTTPAIGIALARERGELKRLRGTPAPPWTFVAGRIVSAAGIALLGVLVMVAAGVLFYGVQIVWSALPAAVVTLLVGIACFAALGMAVAAVLPTSQMVQAFTTGTVIVLGFVSEMFTGDADLPPVLDAVGWIFPLRHFVTALRDTFIPFHAGTQFAWDHLAVMAAWGVAGVVVAARFFTWAPRREAARRPARTRPRTRPHPGVTRGRRSTAGLVTGQVGHAVRTEWRDVGSVFFAVAFPVLLLVLIGSIWRGALIGGLPLPQVLAPGMAVYGAAITAFANMPETTATARDRGVLKRLSGTPLPMWAYVTGRVGAALSTALVTLVLVVAVGVPLFGIEVSPRGLPALALTFVLGTACLAALGLALVALTPNAKTVSVAGLGILLPLAILSGLFPLGPEEPPVVRAIASVFPLQHFGDALDEALRATTWFPVAWHHLAVMLAWGVAGALVAARFLSVEPGGRARVHRSAGRAAQGSGAGSRSSVTPSRSSARPGP
ncbi:MAG TPA: ABC transporter permease [Pseudonocardia sp.]|nr:ABC transporter permease [Pseudonocardia sp.]